MDLVYKAVALHLFPHFEYGAKEWNCWVVVVILFKFLRNCQTFPQWLYHITHPQVTWEGFSFVSSLLVFSLRISLHGASSLRVKDWPQ